MNDNKDTNALIEVTLDQDRMYRAKDTDTAAITVKAGVPTKVPVWVAAEWGLAPAGAVSAQNAPALPNEVKQPSKKAN
jgi:hypothetical protein